MGKTTTTYIYNNLTTGESTSDSSTALLWWKDGYELSHERVVIEETN